MFALAEGFSAGIWFRLMLGGYNFDGHRQFRFVARSNL
jgi:hypothetical protein